MTFTPKPTKDENLSEARRWLEKGIAMEAEGKSPNMVNKCLEKALDYENAAFAS